MSISQHGVESGFSTPEILEQLVEARTRTLDLVEDLSDEQLMGPRLAIINPLRWEIGHVAFFQEFWCLRHFRDEKPLLSNGDSMYDSARVAHDTRWDLPLPSREGTLAYMRRVLDRVIELNQSRDDKRIGGYGQDYFLRLALFHEQMHAEAITYTRQTLSYPAPRWSSAIKASLGEGAQSQTRLEGDARIPGGRFLLGSGRNTGFVFDNEQWAHEVKVGPFAISRAAVTEGDFKEFVEAGGYRIREFWSNEGWRWREETGASHPVYWKRDSKGVWLRRRFDKWAPIQDRVAMIHVNYYEAEAYCRWAGRRLPTEAEWEMAASCEPAKGGLAERKRIYPWGDESPTTDLANLDWRAGGCIDVDKLPSGDSAFGCRQMLGNAWEWTSTDFGPYPGFEPGPYKEYSQPWFGDHKVLRGGCWATRSALIRNAYRNFYQPHRRDVWAGFRTCAL
jgi:iron(II)-dependent oxidoreductase